MRAPRWLVLSAAGLLVAGGAAGITYALWGDGASAAAGVIRSGTLDLQLTGYPTWAETSSDVAPVDRHSGTVDASLTVDHLTTPGDTITITQPFTTVLDGDNLAARLTVGWANGSVPVTVGGRVSATYRVTMPDGTTSAATPLGTAVTMPGAPDNLVPAEAAGTWTLVVTVVSSGTDLVVAPSGIGTAPNFQTGDIVIELNQVRDGTGFTP